MAKKKKKCKCKEKELYYQGASYLTINTFNESKREKYIEAIAEFAMKMHKCRIAVYPTLNIGAPHCGPNNCT
jgi:hypothetical protein